MYLEQIKSVLPPIPWMLQRIQCPPANSMNVAKVSVPPGCLCQFRGLWWALFSLLYKMVREICKLIYTKSAYWLTSKDPLLPLVQKSIWKAHCRGETSLLHLAVDPVQDPNGGQVVTKKLALKIAIQFAFCVHCPFAQEVLHVRNWAGECLPWKKQWHRCNVISKVFTLLIKHEWCRESVIAIGHTLKGRLRKVFLQKVVAEAEKHVHKNVQSAHVVFWGNLHMLSHRWHNDSLVTIRLEHTSKCLFGLARASFSFGLKISLN